jgi:peptidoglycan/LPS O-acetylase OafA/YrhL
MTRALPAVSYEAYRSVRVFSCLDGLRCLSVLAVVWHHSANVPSLTRYFPAARNGFLGVDLFFEISGFLIVTLLLRERSERNGISLRGFYARRVLRIFPLYYGLLVFFAVLFFWVRPHGGGAAAFRDELWVMLLYLSNWIPVTGMLALTWSLAVEEQFYLLWPPVEKWLSRFAAPLVLFIIVASQVVHFGWMDAGLEAAFGWDSNHPEFLRQVTLTPICLGVLLAHSLHDPAHFAWFSRWLGRPFTAPALLLGLVFLANVLPADMRGLPRVTVHVLMFFLLASTVVSEKNGLASFLTLSVVARIGALSYGVYLLHHIALGVTRRGLAAAGFEVSPLPLFLVGVVLAIGMAELSYRFYETRFLKLRGRFR